MERKQFVKKHNSGPHKNGIDFKDFLLVAYPRYLSVRFLKWVHR